MSGASGAVYGAGIGALAGAGAGYLLDGEEGAWAYGIQGGVSGATAGYSTSELEINTKDGHTITTSNNGETFTVESPNGGKTDWKLNDQGAYEGSGLNAENQIIGVNSDGYKFETFNSNTNTQTTTHFTLNNNSSTTNVHHYSQNQNGITRLSYNYNIPNQITVMSPTGEKTNCDYNPDLNENRIHYTYSDGQFSVAPPENSASARVYSTERYDSTHACEILGSDGTTETHYFNRDNGSYTAKGIIDNNTNTSVTEHYNVDGEITHTTYDNHGISHVEVNNNLSATSTANNQSSWGKTWDAIKNSPITKEVLQGTATTMVMNDFSSAIAGDIYLDTVDKETGEWDEEKAEFWTTVACFTVAGILNPVDTLDLKEVDSSQGWLGTVGKGMAVGALGGLSSAYAVKTARHHFVDDKDDEDDIERFNETIKPAIAQLGAVVGLHTGRRLADVVGTFKQSKGLHQYAGSSQVDIEKELLDFEKGFKVTGTMEEVEPLLGSDYSWSISDNGDGTCTIVSKEHPSVLALAGDRENAQNLALRNADASGAHYKPVGEWGQNRGVEFNANSQLNVDKHLNESGNYEVVSWTDKNGTLNVVSITPEDKHKFGNQTNLTEFTEQAYGHGDSAKGFVSDINRGLARTPGKGIEQGIVYDKVSVLQIGKGKDYRLPTGQHIGDKHVELHSNEWASPGQITWNIVSAPAKGVAAEWPRLLGTLAGSYGRRTMSRKGEKTGNRNWHKYASLVGEAAGYGSTALLQYAANSSGAIYRSPLEKLSYNIQTKNEAIKIAKAQTNRQFGEVVEKTLGMSESEFSDYMSESFVAEMEHIGVANDYDEIKNMSPKDALAALGVSAWDVHWKPAWGNIRRNFLSKTASGAVILNFGEFMAKKAPTYWGGQSSSDMPKFDSEKEYKEWRANQELSRAYTLNMATSLIHGAALALATSRDKDIQTEHFAIRNNQVEIGDGLFDVELLKENVGAKEKGDTLRIPREALKRYLGENDYTQEWDKLVKEKGDSGTFLNFTIMKDDFISTADGNFNVAQIENPDAGIMREGDFIVIPHEVLQENRDEQFTKQWAMTDKAAGYGESMAMTMGGAQMAAIREGLSFGYSGIYEQAGKTKHRGYTPFEWAYYVSNARNLSGVFSSKAAMRNYWAGVYTEGAKAHFAGTVCTVDSLANAFGSLPERAIIRPEDSEHPELGGYRVFFKNVTYPRESAFVKPQFYRGPYPKQFVIDGGLAQERLREETESINLSLPSSASSAESGISTLSGHDDKEIGDLLTEESFWTESGAGSEILRPPTWEESNPGIIEENLEEEESSPYKVDMDSYFRPVKEALYRGGSVIAPAGFYTAGEGETLSEIAAGEPNGVTAEAIAGFSDIKDPDKIRPRQTLEIPLGELLYVERNPQTGKEISLTPPTEKNRRPWERFFGNNKELTDLFIKNWSKNETPGDAEKSFLDTMEACERDLEGLLVPQMDKQAKIPKWNLFVNQNLVGFKPLPSGEALKCFESKGVSGPATQSVKDFYLSIEPNISDPELRKKWAGKFKNVHCDNVKIMPGGNTKIWDEQTTGEVLNFLGEFVEQVNKIPPGILEKSTKDLAITIHDLGKGGYGQIEIGKGHNEIALSLNGHFIEPEWREGDHSEFAKTIVHEITHHLTVGKNSALSHQAYSKAVKAVATGLASGDIEARIGAEGDFIRAVYEAMAVSAENNPNVWTSGVKLAPESCNAIRGILTNYGLFQDRNAVNWEFNRAGNVDWTKTAE